MFVLLFRNFFKNFPLHCRVVPIARLTADLQDLLLRTVERLQGVPTPAVLRPGCMLPARGAARLPHALHNGGDVSRVRAMNGQVPYPIDIEPRVTVYPTNRICTVSYV